MTVSTELARMLNRIRTADMSTVDRESLRPAWAALDEGKSVIVPARIEARIRDISARMPKQP